MLTTKPVLGQCPRCQGLCYVCDVDAIYTAADMVPLDQAAQIQAVVAGRDLYWLEPNPDAGRPKKLHLYVPGRTSLPIGGVDILGGHGCGAEARSVRPWTRAQVVPPKGPAAPLESSPAPSAIQSPSEVWRPDGSMDFEAVARSAIQLPSEVPPGASVLTFDIETHSSEFLWDMSPEEFFRLGGYAWGEGEVVLTEDLEEIREQIRLADLVVGHNIHSFDLTAVFGVGSTYPLEMARDGRVYDTWTHATLHHPAPHAYEDRAGRTRYVTKPEQAMHWFSLDNQAYHLNVAGKSHDLKALAKEFGGFGNIPVDDPRFRDYLVQDVTASRQVADKLLRRAPLSGYSIREQLNAAIDAQNSRNGWRVDFENATARVKGLDDKKNAYLEMLSEKFGLPTEGKAPLRTKAGKEAVLAALESVGVTEADLPKTAKGAPSFGGDGLLEAVEDKGEEARELGKAIAAIGGMRPLAQSALDCVHADGKVHPSITTLQRSGRKSTTKPGLTVWTSRGAGSVEKSYFIPNAEDEVLVEFDYSQADARIVAAYSGDSKFAERFAPGTDMHMITAYLIWGRDVVDADPAFYRQEAKAVTHASAYRAGPGTLARTTGRPEAEMRRYNANYASEYKGVTAWQDRTTREGERNSAVVNSWGRRMVVDKDRAYTQSPALYGQSGTREIVVDALIRMPNEVLCMLVAQVHDALVFSIPEARLAEVTGTIKRCMETTWGPPDGSGQQIHFPVGMGNPAKNWEDAGH